MFGTLHALPGRINNCQDYFGRAKKSVKIYLSTLQHFGAVSTLWSSKWLIDEMVPLAFEQAVSLAIRCSRRDLRPSYNIPSTMIMAHDQAIAAIFRNKVRLLVCIHQIQHT